MQPVSGLLNTGVADHTVILQSFAPGQKSGRLVTRATPIAFAVRCLVQEIQTQHADKLEAHLRWASRLAPA